MAEDVVLRKVREETEILAGRRGPRSAWAVRFRDMNESVSSIALSSVAQTLPKMVEQETQGLSSDVQTAQQTADQAVAEAAAADAKAQSVRNDHDALTLGFTGTLDAAFTDVDTEISTAKSLALAIDGVPANVELPAEAWTPFSQVGFGTLIKPAVPASDFQNGGYEFPDTANRTFGQAAGIPYEHGHFYEVTYVFSVIEGPVEVTFGATGQTGTTIVRSNAQVGLTTHTVAEGEITTRVQFALAPDAAATGADRALALTEFTNDVDRMYPHIRQNPGDSTPTAGRIRVRRMIVRDVTQEINAGAFTRDWAYSVSEADNAIAAAGTDLKAQIEDPNGTSVGAALNQESLARVNADNALASDITSLTATVNGNSGSITDILGLNVSGSTSFGALLTQLQVDAGGTSATITQQGSAIATLEGNASATQVFRVKAGSAGAELELIAASDPDGQASIARLSATNILLRGSVAADFLTVGTGRNLLTNARFRTGISDWHQVNAAGSLVDLETSFSLRVPGTTWSGGLYPTLMIWQNGIETDSDWQLEWRDINDPDGSAAPGVPVAPGDWYEASAFISAHRCTTEINIVFYSATGIPVASTPVVPIGERSVTSVPGPSDTPDLWTRLWDKRQVPAGAAFATLRIIKSPTLSGANSFAFIHKPQIIESHEFAELPAPFSETGATIIGPDGILTGAVTADKISVTDLSAISADLGTIQVDTANIALLAVDVGNIKDLAVNTIKIADGAVTVMRSANGTTTASISFTPQESGEVVVLAGLKIAPNFDGNTGLSPGGAIELRRNGSIARTGTAFPDGFIFHSITTQRGSPESISVTASQGTASNARLVLLERFK